MALTLTVGFMNAIKRTEDGQYAGSIPAIMREVAAQTELKLNLKPMPIKHLLSRLKNGELDAAIGLFKNPKRLQYAVYIPTSVGRVGTRVFTLKNNPQEIDAEQLLSGKTVGLLSGAALGELIPLAIAKKSIKPLMATSFDVFAYSHASRSPNTI